MSDCGRCFEDIKQCGVVYENPGWRDSLIWEGAVQLFREKAFYAQETTTQMPTGESLLSWVQEGAGDEGLLHAQRETRYGGEMAADPSGRLGPGKESHSDRQKGTGGF